MVQTLRQPIQIKILYHNGSALEFVPQIYIIKRIKSKKVLGIKRKL